MAQQVTHHRELINGFRMHFVTAGEGEPLVLLHGFPETSYAWRKVIPPLAERFTVIAPDLPGCGDSDKPAGIFTKAQAAGHVFELLQFLNLGPINLVGHDVGMMVAYAYATMHRSTVKRLALLEAALPGLGLEELYDADKHPRMYHLPLFEAPNGFAEALITGREQMFVEHFMRQQTYDPTGPEQAALDEYSRRLASPGALSGGISYFRSHKADAVQNQEAARVKLAMPVLTVGGTASFGANLAPQIKPLVERLESVMIDQCGHYLAEEQPEAVVKELLRFFSAPSES